MQDKKEKQEIKKWLIKKRLIPFNCENNEYWTAWINIFYEYNHRNDSKDFMCHDKLVANACEDFKFKKCKKQCDKCKL